MTRVPMTRVPMTRVPMTRVPITDVKLQAYQHSVRTAVHKAVQASLYDSSAYLPHRLIPALYKLYGSVAARVPYSVLAVYDVSMRTEVESYRRRIYTQLLLRNGWDLEMSVLTYKNFRLAHPALRYDPQMWRTFSRQQLRDELGVTFGDIMADICADPRSQPLFAALMFGELDAPIKQAFVKWELGFMLDDSAIITRTHTTLDFSSISTAIVRNHGLAVPADVAMEQYRTLTGHDYTEPHFNPRTHSYDQDAIRAALRQADCTFDPYRQDTPQG